MRRRRARRRRCGARRFGPRVAGGAAPRGKRCSGGSSSRAGRSPRITAAPSGVSSATGRSPPSKSTQPGVTQRRSRRSSHSSLRSFSTPKVRVSCRPARTRRGSRHAAQQLHGRGQPEATVDARDRRERLAHDERRLLRVRRLDAGGEPLAHVAAAAAGERLLLVAEVAQDRVVAAAAALGVAQQLEEQVPLVAHRLGIGRAVAGRHLEQAAAQRHVVGRDQQQPDRIATVAAGAADLLVVRLDRAGRRQVEHGAHVGAVDAHAERVGRDDHLDCARREAALGRVARRGVEAGVIDGRVPAGLCEPRAFLFRGAPRGRVDDRGAALAAGHAERLDQRGVDGAFALELPADVERAQRQVRPREAAHQLRRVGRQRRGARGSRRARSASRSRCRRARAPSAARRAARRSACTRAGSRGPTR